MTQHRRIANPRIARMLRELEGAEIAQNDAANVAKSVTACGTDLRKRTAEQWFKAGAVGVVPLLRGTRVRQI